MDLEWGRRQYPLVYFANVFHEEILIVVIDRQGDQLQIFVKKINILAVLIFPVHAIATTQIYLSRIRFFLPFPLLLNAVSGSFFILEKVVQKNLHSTLICLHTFYWDILLTSCCHQLLEVGAGIHEHEEVFLPVIQLLNVLLRIEFLRWKYKLFSTGWWSIMFCDTRIRHQISTNFIAKLICVLLERINQFESAIGYATISSFQQLSALTFLVMPTGVMKLYTEVFELLTVELGLTTKYFTSDQFLADLCDNLVGSLVWQQNYGNADILLQFLLDLHNASHESYNTIQALLSQPGTNAIQYHPRDVSFTFIYFLACYHRLLGVCRESTYLDRSTGVGQANDICY
ncbi:uncharacterized protein LOC113300329 [Papaver somniferum]|uniref:uncharacterized protein LOC113300329 n=1 Tax=Papaver somniferum TaxID=3469 RepID=UPI000E6F8B17|nr:uncharacterized protein LOC113300329 [Papaver somniferum]